MIARLLKITLAGVFWTYAYILLSQAGFVHLWHFDYLSSADWQQISYFWQGGGTIRQGKDYLFLFSLLMIAPIWLIGWKIFYKIKYLELLMLPLTLYNSYIMRIYGANSQRTILRNMGTSKKIAASIKARLAAVKPSSWNDAAKIRDAIQNTIGKQENKQ